MTTIRASIACLFFSLSLAGCQATAPRAHGGHGHGHGHGHGGHSHKSAQHGHGRGHGHAHGHGGEGHGHSHAKAPRVEPQRVEGLGADQSVTLRARVEAAMEAHDFARSLKLLAQLRREAPSDLWVRLMLSDALVEAGRLDEAETELQAVLNMKPCAAAYLRAGYLLHLRGETATGVQVLELAVECAGDAKTRAWANAELGDLLWHQGRGPEAAASFLRAERLDSSLARARVGRARVLAGRGELKQAAELLGAAASTPEHLSELACWEAALGRTEAAGQTVARARRMAEADAYHWGRQAAVALADHGQGSRWAVDLARAELERRGNPRGWDAFAWALHAAGESGAALEASRRALAEGTQEPLFLYRAAVIAEANGRLAEARAHYARALRLNPSFHQRFAPLAFAALQRLGYVL